MKNKNKKIIIIGAGLGGMTAGAYLARAGFEVTILEKNNWAGGRIQEWREKGYRFDLGPSFYWMPEVIDEFFRDMGENREDYFELKRLDPSYTIYFDDEVIDLPASKSGMIDLFERIETGAGRKLEKMLGQSEKIYKVAMKKFIPKSYKNWLGLIEIEQIVGGLEVLAQYNGFRSVESYIRSYFKNEKLIKMLSFPVFFLGESTRRIPSVYNMMNHVDINLGTWHPMGGFGKVAEGMRKVAEKMGVKIIFDAEVIEMKIEEAKKMAVNETRVDTSAYPYVKKIKCKDGREFEADIVISNGDYYQTDQKMLPDNYRQYNEKYWESRKLAPSALLVHLGLKKRLNNLNHHTLFFLNSWQENNEILFENKRWPTKPLYYTSCPTKSDTSAAPEGKEVLTMLVLLPSGLKDSLEKREGLSEWLIKDLEERIGEKISDVIEVKKIYGIDDFTHDYNAYKGNAYGLGQALWQTAIFRPSFKNKNLDNLYYCGQFTTPGIGVPLVVVSGRNVASEIIKKETRNWKRET